MKNLAAVLFLLPSLSFAFDGPFSDRDYSSICKGQVISKDGYSLVCKDADKITEVLKAKKTKKVGRISVAAFSAVEDFGVMPDPDTNSIYHYNNQLLNDAGQVVGYLIISGYENSEMEYKMQLTQKLNLKGELISAKIKD